MKRLVVKIGSNILASGTEGLDLDTIRRLAQDVSEVADMGYEVVMVSSGAVAAGMKKLGLLTKPKEIRLKQAAAAVGQSSLMWAYEKAFAEFGKNVAQVLLTREDFADRKKYINSKNTLLTLLSFGVIPIINENDTVATDEIRFGDNDNLAALVSVLIEAERFIILSDVEGLYLQDPRSHPEAEMISHVEQITPDIEGMAGASGSMVGTGGMYSKIMAAKKAVMHGITVNILSGKKAGLLVSTIKGEKHGTSFCPATDRLPRRKGWIAFSARARGFLTIDKGAERAISEMGKSLLPTGIISVEGNFDTGDPVFCVNSEGKRIAKGLANYSAQDIKRIMGKKTSEIDSLLGYKYSDEVIHRDNLVVTDFPDKPHSKVAG